MTTISSIDARFAQTQVGVASAKVTASVQNLVSGTKSDASVADLSVGTVLASRVNTLRVAVNNAGQGKSVLNTAKGALNTILNLLQQQKSLSVKAADDSLSDNERGFLNQEFQAIVTQIDRIASTTNFNGKKLLDGSIDGTGSSVTDLATATGITNEQYSLLKSSDFNTSENGSVITAGDLASTNGIVATNKIVFTTDGASAGGTVTFKIDRDALLGLGDTANDINAMQSVTFAIDTTPTAAEIGTAFVTAVNAAVAADTTGAYSNFAAYNFLDNADGSVTITAKEAGTALNNYRFSVDDGPAGGDVVGTLGGTNVTGATQAAEAIFATGTGTAGTDGIFHVVAANNLASTAASGSITFGAAGTGDADNNGIKNVKTLTVGSVGETAVTTFTFDGVTFTCNATPATTLQFGVGANATSQAQLICEALNNNTTTNADYTFTQLNAVITATAKYFGNGSGKTQTALTAQAAVVTAAGASTMTIASVSDGTGASVVGVDSAAVAGTLTIKDDNGVASGGSTIGHAITYTIAANNTTTAYTATDVARMFAAGMNADKTTSGRLFQFTDTGAGGIVNWTSKEAGVKANEYSFNLAEGIQTYTAVLGASDINGAEKKIAVTTATLGTNQLVSTDDLTFDPTLSGALTGLKGTFTQGAGNTGIAGGDLLDNTVQFQVIVGGKTYTSQSIILSGSTTTSTISNTIAAGTLLTFKPVDGPVDANGIHTNAGFQLRVGTATTLTDVTTPSAGQTSLNTIVGSMQTQLDEVTINQNRSVAFTETDAANSDHTIAAATGTVLAGIRGADDVGSVTRNSYNAGDITLTSNLYAADGTHGRVGQFTVNSVNDTISTTINDEVFTAYLNSTTVPATGNVQVYGKNVDGTLNKGLYTASTKIIAATGGSGTAAGDYGKLNFYSTGTDDGRVLSIDLKHLSDTTIDISTTAGVTALQDALDAVFGTDATNTTSSSLTFQVGVASNDTIDVTVGSAETNNIYKDANAVAQTISVDTKVHAIAASDILDRALNKVVSLVSTVSASITAFDASIQNNNSSVQNADAARSTLLDTDYTTESTNFAEARVRVDAATAVLAQINTRAANLLQLLRQ